MLKRKPGLGVGISSRRSLFSGSGSDPGALDHHLRPAWVGSVRNMSVCLSTYRYVCVCTYVRVHSLAAASSCCPSDPRGVRRRQSSEETVTKATVHNNPSDPRARSSHKQTRPRKSKRPLLQKDETLRIFHNYPARRSRRRKAIPLGGPRVLPTRGTGLSWRQRRGGWHRGHGVQGQRKPN